MKAIVLILFALLLIEVARFAMEALDFIEHRPVKGERRLAREQRAERVRNEQLMLEVEKYDGKKR